MIHGGQLGSIGELLKRRKTIFTNFQWNYISNDIAFKHNKYNESRVAKYVLYFS